MNGSYFSPENMKLAHQLSQSYIEHTLNVYKIAPVKPEIVPIK